MIPLIFIIIIISDIEWWLVLDWNSSISISFVNFKSCPFLSPVAMQGKSWTAALSPAAGHWPVLLLCCWETRFVVCQCEENHLVHTYSAFLNGGKSNPLFFNEHLIALDMTVKMLCNCLASSYESRGKKLHKQGVLLSQGWNLKLSSKICVHQYPPSPPPARLTSSIYTFHGYVSVFIITYSWHQTKTKWCAEKACHHFLHMYCSCQAEHLKIHIHMHRTSWDQCCKIDWLQRDCWERFWQWKWQDGHEHCLWHNSELWSQSASDCCRQGQVMISLEVQGFAKMQEYPCR